MSDTATTNSWVRRPQTSAETSCNADDYERLYTRSVEHSDEFWAEQAERLEWLQKPTKT